MQVLDRFSSRKVGHSAKCSQGIYNGRSHRCRSRHTEKGLSTVLCQFSCMLVPLPWTRLRPELFLQRELKSLVRRGLPFSGRPPAHCARVPGVGSGARPAAGGRVCGRPGSVVVQLYRCVCDLIWFGLAAAAFLCPRSCRGRCSCLGTLLCAALPYLLALARPRLCRRRAAPAPRGPRRSAFLS